ncbi:hypothetical protein BC567DRAFT_231092 [Phyllosticta citribraziliensis]
MFVFEKLAIASMSLWLMACRMPCMPCLSSMGLNGSSVKLEDPTLPNSSCKSLIARIASVLLAVKRMIFSGS